MTGFPNGSVEEVPVPVARPFQVGDRLRLTHVYTTRPNKTFEGVISHFDPAGFSAEGKPFPPYANLRDDDGAYVTSFPMAFEGNYVEFTEAYDVEFLAPAPAPATSSQAGLAAHQYSPTRLAPIPSGGVVTDHAPAPDHGPLAASLSDRTLDKVLSRPAHVPVSTTGAAITEAALRWHAIRNGNAEDVTPLQLLDADDALHMAVKAHIAAVSA